MQIIIDIPDGDYKFIKDLQFYNSGRRSGRTIEQNVILGIRNGIPLPHEPNGDLISRKVLKGLISDKSIPIKFEEEKRGDWQYASGLLLCDICKIIDNTPTVKFSLMPADETKEDAYKGGYEKGKIKGILMANTRPQGEWVKVKEERMSVDMSGEIVTRYKCSKCGRVIATFPGKLADYYPFCHCGADMRKGGADMRNTTETPSSCTTTNPNSVEAYHQSLKGDAE